MCALRPEHDADGIETGNWEEYYLEQENSTSKRVFISKIPLVYYRHIVKLNKNTSDTDKATITLDYCTTSAARSTTIQELYNAIKKIQVKVKLPCTGIITKDSKRVIATAIYIDTKHTSSYGFAFLIDYVDLSDGTEGYIAISDKFSISDTVLRVS